MTQTSFIIPSYNSYKTIDQTLKSVLKQTLLAHIHEILVIDSSDDQRTRALLGEFKYDKLKIIHLDQKTSPALGRNMGAKQASGSLLCFIDSDVTIADTWLDEMLKAYASGCKVGAGSVSIPEFQSHNRLALAQLYLQFNESLDVGGLRKVSMVPACNMFVEKSLFESAGGFPNIRAAEDVLLCLTLAKQTPVWFIPQARCFHIFREDFEAYKRNQIVLGKYIIIYRRQVYQKWFYQGLWPLLLLPIFLIIKATRIKCRIYKAGWGHYKKFVISSPWFAIGMLYWAIGFAQGVFYKDHPAAK